MASLCRVSIRSVADGFHMKLNLPRKHGKRAAYNYDFWSVPTVNKQSACAHLRKLACPACCDGGAGLEGGMFAGSCIAFGCGGGCCGAGMVPPTDRSVMVLYVSSPPLMSSFQSWHNRSWSADVFTRTNVNAPVKCAVVGQLLSLRFVLRRAVSCGAVRAGS